jgi:hypothetical protein
MSQDDSRDTPGDAPDDPTDDDAEAPLDDIVEDTPFGPVPVSYRHNGWVPDRQVAFIEALAATGCVAEAARAVGMTRTSAYRLRQRADAQAFRLAWDAAMDEAVTRLSDAALGRAIHGVPVPIFQGGEQVGERRHFDERLTIFMLRYRDPRRYGKWLDQMVPDLRQDRTTKVFAYRVLRMVRVAWRAFEAALAGAPAPLPEEELLPKDRNAR